MTLFTKTIIMSIIMTVS